MCAARPSPRNEVAFRPGFSTAVMRPPLSVLTLVLVLGFVCIFEPLASAVVCTLGPGL